MEDIPAEGEREAVLSRRQAMRKIGGRAAAIGIGVWIAPEIIIGTPTAAGALSGPPSGGSGGGDGGGSSGGGGGSPGSTTGPNGGSSFPGPAAFGPSTAASSGSNPTSPATAAAGGGALAFTGDNVQRDLEVAGGLIAGGWLLHRWSKKHASDDPQPESP